MSTEYNLFGLVLLFLLVFEITDLQNYQFENAVTYGLAMNLLNMFVRLPCRGTSALPKQLIRLCTMSARELFTYEIVFDSCLFMISSGLSLLSFRNFWSF